LLLLKARAEAARSPALAIPTLRLLAEQDPNDTEVAIRLAETYVQAGEPNRATELMRRQLDLCRPSARPRCQVALASALYKSDKKDEAQVLFDSLLQSEPNDPVPLLALTGLLAGDRLWTQAEQKISDWSDKHPNDFQTPINVANGLIAARDAQALQTAENILTRTLKQNPNSAVTMSALASLYLATGRVSEAVLLNQQILQIDPNNVIAMNNLAWALCVDQNRYYDALDLAERGLKLAPKYVDLIDTRGMIYYRLGQHEKAVQDFTESIKLYPANVPATVSSRFHLARALAQLGRKAEAVQHMEQALYLQARLGGLSEAEVTEARNLLEKLKQGD
jgi:tetratricopeptide (TPR) repeat protein